MEELDQSTSELPSQPTAIPSWKFTTLIKNSFLRMRERFREYAIIAGLSISASVVAQILKYLLRISLPKYLFGPVEIILLVIEILISLWLGLTITLILIQKEKLEIPNVLNKAKKLLKGYLWLFFVTYLFFVGLTPLSVAIFFPVFLIGILLFKDFVVPVIIISLIGSFIIDLLWLLWGSFSYLVYLDRGYRGLKNLWVSRALVNQRFWPFTLRIAFIVLVALVFYSPYIYFLSKFPNSRTPLTFSLQYLFYAISHLLITPFVTSFIFEMYKALPHPTEVQRPKIWIRTIAIVTVLFIALSGIFIGVFVGIYGTDLSQLMKSSKTREQLKQKEDFFQQEIGKINITPVLEIDYKGQVMALCGTDRCHRDLEVIYGGDEPLPEKVIKISEDFSSNGWAFQKITKADNLEEFVKQFEAGNQVFTYAYFKKGDLSALIKFARSNSNTKDCSKTKLCEYARKNQYPYVFSVKYSLEATSKTSPSLTDKTTSIPSSSPTNRLGIKKQLVEQETVFQKELSNINLSPVLGKNDTGSLCGPDQCHRDLEIIYGVDKTLREKILQIEKEFAAKGWRHYGANKSPAVDDFLQQFEAGNSSLGYAVYVKGDFRARVDFGKPNMTGHCFGTIICDVANKKQYPYVVSIRYAIEISTPKDYDSRLIDGFKKSKSYYTDSDIRSILKDAHWSKENIDKAIKEINAPK